MSGDDFVATVMPAVDLVHNLARRLARRPGDAEDLAQDTLTRAWEAWTRGTRPDSVAAWLSTICLNVGRDRARRAMRSREIGWEAEVEALPADTDVAANAIARIQRGQIETALWSLPDAQRIAIVLMDICGLTAAEVGAVTDSPRGTVLARVHRGRKALAEKVRRQDGSGPASAPRRPLGTTREDTTAERAHPHPAPREEEDQ